MYLEAGSLIEILGKFFAVHHTKTSIGLKYTKYVVALVFFFIISCCICPGY